VVVGELPQLPAAAQQVGAAVADVGQLQDAVAGHGRRRGDGGAHPPQRRVAAGPLDDGPVALPDGAGQRLGGLAGDGEGAPVQGGQRLDRHRRGDLAALVAAEAVGDREHGPAAQVAVLVAGPGQADVGPGEAAQPHLASSVAHAQASQAGRGVHQSRWAPPARAILGANQSGTMPRHPPRRSR
jgi:hypothetical protein